MAEACFDRDEDCLLVVVYTQPEEALASALATGTPAAEALEACEKQIGTLLDLVRRRQGRIVLVERTAAHARPDMLAGALRERLGTGFPAVAALPPDKRPRIPEWQRALALLAILERPHLHRQCVELAANTLFAVPKPHDRPCFDMAFSELLALQDEARHIEDEEKRMLSARLSGLEGDFEAVARSEIAATRKNLALLDQLSDAHARMEAAAQENRNLLKRLSEAEARTEASAAENRNLAKRLSDTHASMEASAAENRNLAKRLSEAEARTEAAAAENRNLAKRLSDAHARTEASAAENRNLAKRLSTMKREAKKTQERLDKFYASVSWRLTRPVRAIGRGARWITGGERS